MKKNNTLYLAQESTYQVAATLVEAYHSTSTTAEAKDEIIAGANLISTTINALNSESITESAAVITKELPKHKDTQGHSGLFAKIKEFIKSIINLLRSRFTKRNAEKFRKLTDDTIQEIVVSTHDKANQKSTSALPPIDSQRPSEIITKPKSRPSLISNSPPSGSTNILPPPPPSPPPSITRSHTFPLEGNREAMLAAIRGGIQLKNAAERKSPDITRTTPQDPQTKVIDELQSRLKARRRELGDSHKVVAPASKFAQDAQLFEQARREEAERQARIEQSENIRVAAVQAAEKQDKSLEIKSKPTPINLTPGEIPPPPPPPLSPQANNQVKSFLKETNGSSKNRPGSPQLIVTEHELADVRKKLGKRTIAVDTNHQEGDTANINSQSIAKKKQNLGPSKGYSK